MSGFYALSYRIAYLTKMEQLLADNKDAASFAQALKNAYPNLPGAEGVFAFLNFSNTSHFDV